MLWYANFLDSRLRGNDNCMLLLVIPAKAGIQESIPQLFDKLLAKLLNPSLCETPCHFMELIFSMWNQIAHFL